MYKIEYSFSQPNRNSIRAEYRSSDIGYVFELFDFFEYAVTDPLFPKDSVYEFWVYRNGIPIFHYDTKHNRISAIGDDYMDPYIQEY